jgi:hypothetical protein
MADEMIDSVPWESDEAEDWESDEAMAESEDSAEDIGERARRRRYRRRSHFRPGRGVRGIAVRGQDGAVRNLAFPARLATAAETNRGLASQEVARRALDERLDRLETRMRAQVKNDAAAGGIVALLLGGGLTAWGAFQAANRSRGFSLGNWADENATTMAALTSVSQLATSGAKLAITGRYHRSGFGFAADAFSAAQLAAFALGSLYRPQLRRTVADLATLQANRANLDPDTRYVALDTGLEYETFTPAGGGIAYRLVRF